MEVPHRTRTALLVLLLLVASCPLYATDSPGQQPGNEAVAELPLINGLRPIILHCALSGSGKRLQFLSVTLLPGRAMNLFQITAELPGLGEVDLLQSPSLDQAATRLNDALEDPWGYRSYSMGGAFLIPWASRISGQVTADGERVTADWNGTPLSLRINSGKTYAVHGLVNKVKVEHLSITHNGHGEQVTGIAHAGNFGGFWASSTDLTFTISLEATTIDIRITAKNVGDRPEPMGIGWHPYFMIPDGNRGDARLHITGQRVADVMPSDGKTTGSFTSVAGSPFDFRPPTGRPLPPSMNTNFSDFEHRAGCPASLLVPSIGYGLCVRPLSPQVRTIQVYSPKDSTFVAIEPQFNYPDPLGKEWKEMDTGLVTLRPGQSTVWHVRLQLFRPVHAAQPGTALTPSDRP